MIKKMIFNLIAIILVTAFIMSVSSTSSSCVNGSANMLMSKLGSLSYYLYLSETFKDLFDDLLNEDHSSEFLTYLKIKIITLQFSFM